MSVAAQLRILRGEGRVGSNAARGAFIAKRPSLLFDQNTAADTDSHTIYSIGINGFTELSRKDARFEPFEKTLFAGALGNARAFDREAQTKRVNRQLDESISAFLRVLSPYFLLKPAHKVLEFLIRRYSVHIHNWEAVLECILPYHETTIFAKMLQLLQIHEPRWVFLRTAAKNGVPLSRTTLVTRCLVDTSVLEFVCDLAERSVEIGRASSHYKTALSLYTVLAVKCLDRAKEGGRPGVPEPLLRALLPRIMKGLAVAAPPAQQAANTLVLMHVCQRTRLAPAALDSVLVLLFQGLAEDAPAHTAKGALVPLICILHTQQPAAFPTRTLEEVCRLKNLAKGVTLVAQDGVQVDRLLELLLLSLVERCHNSEDSPVNAALLRDLITTLPQGALDARLVTRVASRLLQLYLDAAGDAKDVVAGVAQETELQAILQTIDQSFPGAMDSCLDLALRRDDDQDEDMTAKKGKKDGSETRADRLLALVQSSFGGSRHEVLEASGTTMFLSLSHPMEAVRLAALARFQELWTEQQSDKTLKKKKGGKKAKTQQQNGAGLSQEYVRQVLLTRLGDDALAVVRAALAFPGLVALLDAEDLFSALEALLARASAVQVSASRRLAQARLGEGAADARGAAEAESKVARALTKEVLQLLVQDFLPYLQQQAELYARQQQSKGKKQQKKKKGKKADAEEPLVQSPPDVAAYASRVLPNLLRHLLVRKDAAALNRAVLALADSGAKGAEQHSFPLLQGLGTVSKKLEAALATRKASKKKSKKSKKGAKSQGGESKDALYARGNAELVECLANNLVSSQGVARDLPAVLACFGNDHNEADVSGRWLVALVLQRALQILGEESDEQRVLTAHRAAFCHLRSEWLAVGAHWGKMQSDQAAPEDSEGWTATTPTPTGYVLLLRWVLASAAESLPAVPGAVGDSELLSATLRASSSSSSESHAQCYLALVRDMFVLFAAHCRASTSLDSSMAALLATHLGEEKGAKNSSKSPSFALIGFLSHFVAEHAAAASLVMQTAPVSAGARSSSRLAATVSAVHILHASLLRLAQNKKGRKSNSAEEAIASAVPTLLLALSHPGKAVRHATLLVVATLSTALSGKTSVGGDKTVGKWLPVLLERVGEFRDETLADSTHLPQLLARLLDHAGSKRAVGPASACTALHRFFMRTAVAGNASAAVRCALLSSLSELSSAPVMDLVLETYTAILAAPKLDEPAARALSLLVARMDAVTITHEGATDALLHALRSERGFRSDTLDFNLAGAALSQLQPDLFRALAREHQRSLFDQLCIMHSDHDDDEEGDQTSIDKVDEHATTADVDPLGLEAAIKRVPVPASMVGAALVAASGQPKLLASVLEVLTVKLRVDALEEGLPRAYALVAVLLQTLGGLTKSPDSEADYVTQLVLTCLKQLAQSHLAEHGSKVFEEAVAQSKAGKKKKSRKPKAARDDEEERGVDAEGRLTASAFSQLGVLVECVAGSAPEQWAGQRALVRNHALALLSTLAQLVPDAVTEIVLPIFKQALAGHAHVDQHDNYSFSVLQQTVESVLPPLLGREVDIAQPSAMTNDDSDSDSDMSSDDDEAAERPQSQSRRHLTPAQQSKADLLVAELQRLFVQAAPALWPERPDRCARMLGVLAGATRAEHLHGMLALLLQRTVESPAYIKAYGMPPEDDEEDAKAQARGKQSKRRRTKTKQQQQQEQEGDDKSSPAAEADVDFRGLAHDISEEFAPAQQVRALLRLLTAMDTEVVGSLGMPTMANKEEESAEDMDDDDESEDDGSDDDGSDDEADEAGKEARRLARVAERRARAARAARDAVLSSVQYCHPFKGLGVARRWRAQSMQLIGEHLASTGFLHGLLQLDVRGQKELQGECLRLFRDVFVRLRACTERLYTATHSGGSKGDGGLNPEAQHLTLLAEHCNTVLDNLNGLLSARGFVAAINTLLDNESAAVRHKALALLNDKVLEAEDSMPDEDVALFVGMLAGLRIVLNEDGDEDDDDEEEGGSSSSALSNKQMALLSIDILARSFASHKAHVPAFQAIIPDVTAVVTAAANRTGDGEDDESELRHFNAHNHVASSALLCLTTLVVELGAVPVLPYLGAFVPASLTVLESTLQGPAPADDGSRRVVGLKNKKRRRQQQEEGSDEEGEEHEPKELAPSMRDLQSSCIQLANALVRETPKFLSPFLQRLLGALLHPALLALQPGENDDDAIRADPERRAVSRNLQEAVESLGHNIAPRLLLPHVFAAYHKALAHGDAALSRLLGVVGGICGGLDADGVRAHYKALYKFFLRAMGLRAAAQGGALSSLKDLDRVEQAAVEALMKLVLKLNEDQLKGLFLKTLEWVGAATAFAGDEDEVDGAIAKSIPFFRLVLQLANTLKGIFVPFFGYVLEHATVILSADLLDARDDEDDDNSSSSEEEESSDDDSNDEDSRKSKKHKGAVEAKKDKRQAKRDQKKSAAAADAEARSVVRNRTRAKLVELVVQGLHQLFANDTDEFLGKEQFGRLTGPMVEQLEIALEQRESVGGGMENDNESEDKGEEPNKGVAGASLRASDRGAVPLEYSAFVQTQLIPCIVQMAQRMGNYTLWKPLNHEVLMLTRSPDASVRYAALKVVEAMYDGMREPLLVLLPETLPFIHELMEDEDIEVEQLTQQVIRQIEELSGEDLQSHLSH